MDWPLKRILSFGVVCIYSSVVLGQSTLPSQTAPLIRGPKIVSVGMLDDFLASYQSSQEAYKRNGPEAFMSSIPYIKDSISRQQIQAALGQLPQLPTVSRCGAYCIQIEHSGISNRIYVEDPLLGKFRINEKHPFQVSWQHDNFYQISEYLESVISLSPLTESQMQSSLFYDAVQKICSLILPQAHAMSAIALAVVAALTVILLGLVVWFVGSKLIDRSEKKAKNVIREADQAAENRITQMEEASHGVIDRADQAAEARITQADQAAEARITQAEEVGDKVTTNINQTGENLSNSIGENLSGLSDINVNLGPLPLPIREIAPANPSP
jgi:hypothetical protein